jgi:4-amino-4-deoxy-L-arabinose transferase-like glycosyltransferase
VVVVGYGIAPSRLPLYGEEECRIQHGIEMVESGDWLIATNQGVPILDRPPGQYWFLAAVHKWIHPLDPLAARMTALAITLATSWLIWGYARLFLSGAAPLLAGVAFPTMGHVFDLGRRAETDGLFALTVVASLLVWHVGYVRRWRPASTWTMGYALTAVASLVKGTQAPVAFVGAVGMFLLARRDWRMLFHWGHGVGILAFAALVAIWQIPFWKAAGWQGTYDSWFAPGAQRLGLDPIDFARHLAVFPLEVVNSGIPWSILLIGLALRPMRRLGSDRGWALAYLLFGFVAIVVPVWLNMGGGVRYTMPAEPLMALMAAFVAEQCWRPDSSPGLQRLWTWFIRISLGLTGAVIAALVAATIAPGLGGVEWARIAQPWPLLAVLMLLFAAAVVIVRRTGPPRAADGAALRTVALALLVAAIGNGAWVNARAEPRRHVGPQITAVREALPAGETLFSFEMLHVRFTYFYEDEIPIVPWPETAAEVPDEVEYFAVWTDREIDGELPFQWQELDRIRIDQQSDPEPVDWILIGRRIE